MCDKAFGKYAVLQVTDGHSLAVKYAKLLKTAACAKAVGNVLL